jgi:hypothetical protein
LDPRLTKDLGKNKCGQLQYVPFDEDPDMIHTVMPTLPMELPGTLSFGDSGGTMPEVLEVYVEAAKYMRNMLLKEEPAISHAQQMKELGEPPPELWGDLLLEIQLQEEMEQQQKALAKEEKERQHAQQQKKKVRSSEGLNNNNLRPPHLRALDLNPKPAKKQQDTPSLFMPLAGLTALVMLVVGVVLRKNKGVWGVAKRSV